MCGHQQAWSYVNSEKSLYYFDHRMLWLSNFNVGTAFTKVYTDTSGGKYPFCGDDLLHRGN